MGAQAVRLPDRLTINKRVWTITGHRRLTPTVDNNVGLIKIAPGRNGRYRFTLQLWRVRPFSGDRPAASSGARAPGAPSRSTTHSNSSSAEEDQVLRHSQSDQDNEHVEDWTDRYVDKDNAAFFADAIASLSDDDGFGHDGLALIGLVGSCDLPGVTLRRAQSILRWDRRPSLWSHAFLLVDTDGNLREVALHSRSGAFPEPADNAITAATLRALQQPARGPERRAARRSHDAGGGGRGRGSRHGAAEPRTPALRPVRDARVLAGVHVDARHRRTRSSRASRWPPHRSSSTASRRSNST